MRRIGFCARLGRRAELRMLADRLHADGHEVVSSWIRRDDRDENMSDEQKADAMAANENDLLRANVVVMFGEKPNVPGAERGCRWVDWGSQFNRTDVRRIVVGPRENLGAFKRGTVHVDSAAQLVSLLKTQK
jgi:hypothetical protein